MITTVTNALFPKSYQHHAKISPLPAGFLSFITSHAGADLFQILPRINARPMPVLPCGLNPVTTHRLHSPKPKTLRRQGTCVRRHRSGQPRFPTTGGTRTVPPHLFQWIKTFFSIRPANGQLTPDHLQIGRGFQIRLTGQRKVRRQPPHFLPHPFQSRGVIPHLQCLMNQIGNVKHLRLLHSPCCHRRGS